MRRLLALLIVLAPAARAQTSPDDLAALVETGNVARLTRLLDGGLAPDAPAATYLGPVPLLTAAVLANQPAAVRLLLDRGARVDAPDARGAQAIHRIGAVRDTAIVRMLLDAGADPTGPSADGTTPLASTLYSGNAAVLEALLHAGATPDVSPVGFASVLTAASGAGARFGAGPVLRLLLAHGATPDARWRSGGTALHSAARIAGVEALVPLLVLTRAGADPDARDGDGATPLDVARAQDGADWAVRFLTGDDEALALARLFDAIDRSDAAAVRDALGPDLAAGAGQDVGSLYRGGTPLHLAALRGDTAVTRLLLDAGADAGLTDSEGHTPLTLAAGRGDLATVRMLLGVGADAGGFDGYVLMNLRPVHEAAASGSLETVRALLDAGADAGATINGSIGTGYNALGFAIAGGHEAIVALLLERDAPPDILGDTDETPLGLARRLHLDAIAARLEAAGATE